MLSLRQKTQTPYGPRIVLIASDVPDLYGILGEGRQFVSF